MGEIVTQKQKSLIENDKIFSIFNQLKLVEMEKKSSLFEQIKKTNEIGQEYWSARELFTVLEYIKWDKFLKVIDKAMEACKNSGLLTSDHFPLVGKMVQIGSGTQRDIGDLNLTRFA